MIKEIEIGGEKRKIDYNFNCLEEFETLTGINPLNGLVINPKNTKILLYCGLKYGLHPEGEKEPSFTVKQVGSWLDPSGLAMVTRAFHSQSEPEKKTELTTQSQENNQVP